MRSSSLPPPPPPLPPSCLRMGPRQAVAKALQLLLLGAAAAASAATSAPPRCFYIHAKVDAKSDRYLVNIHHQSEYVLPAIDKIFQLSLGVSWKAPQVIISTLPLLPWSRAMLQLAARKAVIVDAGTTDPQERLAIQACGSVQRLPSSQKVPNVQFLPYVHWPPTFDMLRSSAARACKVAIPRSCGETTQCPYRIGILDRHSNRRLGDPPALAAALRRSFGKAEVVYRTTADGASICEQIQWFAGVDALVAGHGAALTNSVFLPAGAALVEIMPWSFGTHYTVFRATLKGSGVKTKQVVAHRQPTDVYMKLNSGRYTQEQCGRNSMCNMWHRDHANLTVPPEEVVAALRALKAPRTVCQR